MRITYIHKIFYACIRAAHIRCASLYTYNHIVFWFPCVCRFTSFVSAKCCLDFIICDPAGSSGFATRPLKVLGPIGTDRRANTTTGSETGVTGRFPNPEANIWYGFSGRHIGHLSLAEETPVWRLLVESIGWLRPLTSTLA